jgi:hypothetical protein
LIESFSITIKSPFSSTWVGLCDPHFPLYSRHLFIGRAPFSYGFSSLGDIVASGHIMDDYAEPQFCEGDVIGCGLRIKREQGKAEVFFTRNGLPFCESINNLNLGILFPTIWHNIQIPSQIHSPNLGHPIGMPIFATGPALLLYPAVTLKGHFTKVEANFGDDPANKPFRYNGP